MAQDEPRKPADDQALLPTLALSDLPPSSIEFPPLAETSAGEVTWPSPRTGEKPPASGSAARPAPGIVPLSDDSPGAAPPRHCEHYEILTREDSSLFELGRGAMGITSTKRSTPGCNATWRSRSSTPPCWPSTPPCASVFSRKPGRRRGCGIRTSPASSTSAKPLPGRRSARWSSSRSKRWKTGSAGIDPEGIVTFYRFDVCWIERDLAAAERVLAECPLETFRLGVITPLHKSYLQGLIHALRRADLGVLYAAMGWKEAAVAEGRRAVALCPESADAVNAAAAAVRLAKTYSLLGDADNALPPLEHLLAVPAHEWNNFSLKDLRLHPEWDPLRADPRFQRLLTSAPATGSAPAR